MDEAVVVARTIEILRQLSSLSISTLRTIATDVSVDQAIELADALLQFEGVRDRTPSLRCLTIEWYFAAARIPECVATARKLAADRVPSEFVSSAEMAEILALAVAEPGLAAQRATQLLRTAQPETGPAVAVAAAAVLADACWSAGRLEEGLRWARRANKNAGRLPAPFWRMYLRIGLANKLADVGDLEAAETHCREIQAELALVPCPGIAAGVAAVRTRTLIHRRQWAKTYSAVVDQQIERARSSGDRMLLPQLLGCLAVADMYSGDIHAARTHLAVARSLLVGGGAFGGCASNSQWTVVHQWVEIFVCHACDGAAAALELYERTFSGCPAAITGLFAQVTGSPAWLVWVAVTGGRADIGRHAVQLAEELSRRNPGLPHLALAAEHARSLLVADVAGLVRVANHQSHQWAKARAASDLVTTVDAATASTPPAVRRQAGRGLPRFPDVEADDNLTTVSTWAGLSEREQRIAQFVVQGLTNRQIATRSDCSVHTVNYHLRNIFRKLGIRSRIEITHFVPARATTTRGPAPTHPR